MTQATSPRSPQRKLPAPLMNPEAKPYFDAAAEGRLIYRHCGACGHAHHPPRSICPTCRSLELTWKTASGLGTVYSASTLHRGVPVPYCIAWVSLDEGVTLMTNLVDTGGRTPPVATRVQLRFVEAEGGAQMPVFTPVGTPS